MNILDLSNVRPFQFGFTSARETYDYEKPERLLALLKQVVLFPFITLLVNTYELEYITPGTPHPLNPADVFGRNPPRTKVTLHPRLFLLCLRCPDLHHDNQVHARELIRHLEAEIMRRKLQLLIEE